jgi:hypothetical protein
LVLASVTVSVGEEAAAAAAAAATAVGSVDVAGRF